MGPRLDREQLYWELSHHTHGVTQLGFFTLDKDSLYVNGEHPFCNHKLKLRFCLPEGMYAFYFVTGPILYVVFCLNNLPLLLKDAHRLSSLQIILFHISAFQGSDFSLVWGTKAFLQTDEWQ